MRLKWRFGVPLLLGTAFALLAGMVLASPAGPSFYVMMFVPAAGSPLGVAPSNPPTDTFNSFDISFVDPTTGLLYVADRGYGGAGFLDEFDPTTNKLVQQFAGFTGNKPAAPGGQSLSGPNGVWTATQLDQVWGGDGNSVVKVFDVRTGKAIANIPTNGLYRADEGAFDPADNLSIVANDNDSPPFVTIVNAFNFTIVKQIKWDGAPGDGPNAIVGGTNEGIEQPQWYPTGNEFLVSSPGTTAHPGGEIDAINPKTFAVTTFSSLGGATCTPQGLAIGPNGNVLAACNATATLVLNSSGAVIASISQIYGTDEAYYNPTTNLYYTGSSSAPGGAAIGVINAATNAFVALVPTQAGSHSVASDPITGEVFVPIKDQVISGNVFPGGIAVFK